MDIAVTYSVFYCLSSPFSFFSVLHLFFPLLFSLPPSSSFVSFPSLTVQWSLWLVTSHWHWWTALSEYGNCWQPASSSLDPLGSQTPVRCVHPHILSSTLPILTFFLPLSFFLPPSLFLSSSLFSFPSLPGKWLWYSWEPGSSWMWWAHPKCSNDPPNAPLWGLPRSPSCGEKQN